MTPSGGPRRPPRSAPARYCLPAWTGDGTGDGYDLALTRAVSEAVTVPVVASGGCGSPGHMAEALSGPADAALAASILHYDSHGVRGVKEFLRGAGIPVRL
ncbi:MAG: HisA/HisF-related TIM barrel protein [Nitrosopumilus sp.]|nr:HisA/HisF-related TIM barrel protein [Nitrosopumilus sp.]